MSPRKPRKQVYVSSTFSDLEQHRAHLKLALEKAGYDVECMERYAAFDTRPADKCLADVAACDVYVVLVALRYGHIPAEDNPAGKSITELEYDKAVETTCPKLAFVLDDEWPWPPKCCDTNWQDANSNITRFRERVGKELGRALFTTPESLATAVLQALRQQEIAEMPAGERDHAQIREAYLDWLRRECASVELLGLDTRETQNVRLGQVYVPALTYAKGVAEDVIGRAYPLNFSENRGCLLLEALGKGSFYVPGAPGAGKSTFCRWLAYVVAGGEMPVTTVPAPEGFVESLPASLRGRLPVLCRLREWAGCRDLQAGNGRWSRMELEASLVGWISSTAPGELTPDLFRAELNAGNCLLILDGVDEVPDCNEKGDYPRKNLLSGLSDALSAWHKAGNVVILTSRPYGLEPEERRRLRLPEAELAELHIALQHLFVRRWYAAADPLRATEKAVGLLAHLEERDELAELCQNPMLLTALCVKYDEGQRLPQDFYKLYDAVVSQVLHKRYLTDNERERVSNRLAAVALGMHRGVQDGQRTTPAAEITREEVDQHLALLTETDSTTEAGNSTVVQLREDLLSSSGLLLPRADKRAAFYHLSFQEFLAAVRLRRLGVNVHEVLELHAPNRAWHRTLRFLFCAIADRDSPEAAVKAYGANLLPKLASLTLIKDPNPAQLLADCLQVIYARDWSISNFVEPFIGACRVAMTELHPPERAHLWLTLGRLGLDDRPGVGLRPDGLPDIVWQDCEAGDFLYGEARETRMLKTPFRIARYPVTHRQFQAFIDAGGYGQDEWWAGLAERPEAIPAQWSEPNAPRETVSWYEATAFCRWLDVQFKTAGLLPDGWRVSLPTEEQWERAARGTDGREYPWEGEFRSGLANIDETLGDVGPCNLGRTSPVGIYPDGQAPSGALDMAGNVWEWCRNEYEQPERCGDAGDSSRVVRGGSWFSYSVNCRAAARSGRTPGGRYDGRGFRVCCAPPIV